PNGVLAARVALPAAAYPNPERVVATFQQMADAAASIPGVTRASVSSFAAMGGGGGTNGLLPEGQPFALGNLILSGLRIITPGFFEAMRVPNEVRSEEHTSELQSRRDLVCRLLLEKKKRKRTWSSA